MKRLSAFVDSGTDGVPLASPGSSKKLLVVLGLLTVAAFLLFRLPFVSVPFERDEGEYAYMAQRWLAGELPYRDAFNQKPPGVLVVYAATFLLIGESVEAVHGMLYLWAALTALALHAVMRRLMGVLGAMMGVLVFVIVAADPMLTAIAANTEQFMLLPMVASIWLLMRGLEGLRGSWLGCGACAAAACWFKPVAIANVLFILGVLLVTAWRKRALMSASRGLLGLLLGAVLVSVPFPLYFALKGAWPEFLDAVFLHNLDYVSGADFSAGMRELGKTMARWRPSGWIFLALAASTVLLPRARRQLAWRFSLGWLACSFLGASVGLLYFPHYLLQAVPALACLCGLAAQALVSDRRGQRMPGLLCLGLGLTLLAVPVLAHREILWADSPGDVSRRVYGANPFPEAPILARYIRENSSPDATVLVMGSEPQVLFHAQRRSATRYIIFHPVMGKFSDARTRQREVLEEVGAAQPQFVVWVQIPTSFGTRKLEKNLLLREIRQMISDDFTLEVLAAPTDRRGDYAFFYGEEARQVQERDGARLQHFYLAIYRRSP